MHSGAKDDDAIPDGAIDVPEKDTAANLGFQVVKEMEMEQTKEKRTGKGTGGPGARK
jgi:hypothetical protein